MTKPIINKIDGIKTAFFKSNTSFKYLLSLILTNDLAIMNKIILIMIKSKPYKTWASNENGFCETNTVR